MARLVDRNVIVDVFAPRLRARSRGGLVLVLLGIAACASHPDLRGRSSEARAWAEKQQHEDEQGPRASVEAGREPAPGDGTRAAQRACTRAAAARATATARAAASAAVDRELARSGQLAG